MIQQLRHQKIYSIHEDYLKLYREIKHMSDGRVKFIREGDLYISFRYSCKKITKVYVKYDWMKEPILTVNIKHIKNYVNMRIDVSNKYYNDLKIADIYDGNIISVDDIDNIHLYVMKCLHLSKKKVYAEVHYDDKRYSHKMYVFIPYIEFYNDIPCINSYCEDIRNNTTFLFQTYQSLYNEDRVVREYIGAYNHRLFYDTNGISYIVNDNDNTVITFTRDKHNRVNKIKDGNNVTTFEYKDGLLCKVMKNGNIHKDYVYTDSGVYYTSGNMQYKVIETYYK